MPRLFTGVEVPPSIGQSLAMMRGGLPGARWIDPENYHLTLRFIGDLDDALAGEIAGMNAPFTTLVICASWFVASSIAYKLLTPLRSLAKTT